MILVHNNKSKSSNNKHQYQTVQQSLVRAAFAPRVPTITFSFHNLLVSIIFRKLVSSNFINGTYTYVRVRLENNSNWLLIGRQLRKTVSTQYTELYQSITNQNYATCISYTHTNHTYIIQQRLSVREFDHIIKVIMVYGFRYSWGSYEWSNIKTRLH